MNFDIGNIILFFTTAANTASSERVVLLITALGSAITAFATIWLANSSNKQARSAIKQADIAMMQIAENRKTVWVENILSVAADLLGVFEEIRFLGLIKNTKFYSTAIINQSKLKILLQDPKIDEMVESLRVLADKWEKLDEDIRDNYFDLRENFMKAIIEKIK